MCACVCASVFARTRSICIPRNFHGNAGGSMIIFFDLPDFPGLIPSYQCGCRCTTPHPRGVALHLGCLSQVRRASFTPPTHTYLLRLHRVRVACRRACPLRPAVNIAALHLCILSPCHGQLSSVASVEDSSPGRSDRELSVPRAAERVLAVGT